MKDLLKSITENWLPTKWSRFIAGLTIGLSGAAIYLPEFLQKYDIQLSKEKIVLIRVSVPLLLLWIGTFFVLFLVVQYSAVLRERLSDQEKKSADLETKAVALEKEKVTLQSKIEILETKAQQLTKDNEELRQKIQSDQQKHSKEMMELTEKYEKDISKMRRYNGKAGSGLGPHL